jgi:ribosome biogenesis GTPase A
MTVQWFPGHMTRARREIEEKIKLIDVVIELVDARIPLASRNPMIDQILKNKPRLILLNKSDLADPQVTQRWVNYFSGKLKIDVQPLNAVVGNPFKIILPKLNQLFLVKKQKMQLKGIRSQEYRILIVGIPNVGKSTLINQLVGKKIANTGDQPGVTKGQQWIKLSNEIALLDTPGILWPKFEDPQVGLKLAITGAIKSEVLPHMDVALFAVQLLSQTYPKIISDYFHYEFDASVEDKTQHIYDFIHHFGKSRGMLKLAGKIDVEKAALVFLRELRAGKYGRLSFEVPDIN